MKKQVIFLAIVGLFASTSSILFAPHGGGGGSRGGGGHVGGGRAGGGHVAGAHSSHAGGHGGHSGHGGRGGYGRRSGYGGRGGYGYRGWGWGFYGSPFWWGFGYPYPFLYVGGVAAWNVANQTPDVIIVTTGNNQYTIDAGDNQLIPKSGNGTMHIQANYNNTGGTYTNHNTYIVAGDKEGKLVMDSDPGTQDADEDNNDNNYTARAAK